METVPIESSSEDDEDMYLNSVAKLKALKKKQPSPNSNDQNNEEEVQEKKEELKIEPPKEIVATRITKQRTSKRNTSRRGSARQRQRRRDVAEVDSDLEIVSVEERPASSENDLLILENHVDDNPHHSEDENYEINIKVLWRSKEVHRLNIRRNENFRQIYEYFANLEQVSIDDILITRKEKTIKKSDSPASINLSVIDILEGGVVKRDPASQKNSDGKPDEDTCIIKVQTTSKKCITISVRQDENFETLLVKCAQELNVEKSKIKLYFDGELVAITDTPESLEIEDEACFDLRLSS